MKLVAVDIECLPNYFLIAFKGLESGKLLTFDIHGESARFDSETIRRIQRIMVKHTTFGFNSERYDVPMIAYALTGASTRHLHKLSSQIIENNQPNWMTYRNLDIRQPSWDHIDIMEPSPAVMISLKNYGTRVGSRILWDFFVDPNKPVDVVTAEGLKRYCENDVDVTIDLYRAIEARLKLREDMSKEYGLDLRSKSDAQIAEAVIVSELRKLGVEPSKPELRSDYTCRYKAPGFVHFESDELQQLVKDIEATEFDLQTNGQVKMPKTLANRKIKIGNTVYKMGVGGLHSQEKSLSVVSDGSNVMRNADFASYYPALILELGLFPKHLSRKFLGTYGKIRSERIAAKAKVSELKKELEYVLSQKG